MTAAERHWILADAPYEMQRAGLRKGGVYGYPHSIYHDGHICVIVSVRKEAVMVVRVSVAELS